MQHLVRRKSDTIHDIQRIEGGLLDFGAIVFRVAVQFQDTYIHQREVSVRPYLRQIEGVDVIVVCLFDCHQLDLELPFREIAFLDAFEKVTLV